ncbi:MAG: pyrroloquinoline quinone biosynthesis peptide chaperone PqqD [Alphaproteobacteria bacterium]|nr:pyrroloquinoline quinone biosynthesis peptide chaperone PqqD [Alphaproteobacteria bacterium]
MSERLIITGDSIPALPRHIRLKHDESRDAWVILAPERVLMPDEIAVEILQRCDGEATVSGIAAALAREFAAPEDEIRTDIIGVLQDLADKGFLTA